MTFTWKPSKWGRWITGSKDWELRLDGEWVELAVEGNSHRVPIEGSSPIGCRRGLFWTRLSIPGHIELGGIPHADAIRFLGAIDAVLTEQKRRTRRETFLHAYQLVREWTEHLWLEIKRAKDQCLWITHEQQQAFLESRPSLPISNEELDALAKDPDIQSHLGHELKNVEENLRRWSTDLIWKFSWTGANSDIARKELVARKDLFDRVEKQPLSEEQARAVICFDNRVQVVASAGSGKSSTMVAKAAYAIHRGLVKPERIVLLAFNKKAADELKERAAQAFERLGMEGVSVVASTFHALGLSIIGKATSEKPDIPDWASDTVGGFRKLSEIVDELKDHSPEFRTRWDLFRIVFGRDLPSFGSPGEPDSWDKAGDARHVTTLGERVRSYEEFIIANWLYYNGVSYAYERPYEFKTADEDHRQYKPDFFYPDIGLYHEHFALNERGEAPPEFRGYLEGVAWKRQLHRERGTDLIETTSSRLRSGQDFDHLGKALTQRGIVLDPNPNRPVPEGGRKPMDHAELVGLVRTFISHAKSNCLTIDDMLRRLDGMPEDTFKHRHRMFLDIIDPILNAWDRALAAEGGIDFEDMLNQAAEHLEEGRYEAPYDLVMADEFQDASRARARLCRALVQKPGRFLFAVGDDWQSINRFAGADVSVMTGFREWFGHGQILKLEQTFRCPQALCDVSSQFVSKNPAQIAKEVRSITPAAGPVLQAFQVDHRDKLQSAIDRFLDQLCQDVREGRVPPSRGGKVSVFILGRYNADRAYMPARLAQYGRWLDLSFLTVHRSKGSEADYVILPSMVNQLRSNGFPNTRSDDPVLALAMPSGDSYPLGEERRLFYVALTRARRSVAMFTVIGQHSKFLDELEEDGALVVTGTDGETIKEKRCTVCKQGVIVTRNGPYGEFESCSNFPFCEHKPRKAPAIAIDRMTPQQSTTSKGHAKACVSTSATTISQPAKPTLGGIFRAINNGVSALNDSVDEFNKNSMLRLDIMKATSELELDISAERSAIQAALEIARTRLETQERLNTDRHFRQAYEHLSGLLDTPAKSAQAPVSRKSPTFGRVSAHPIPDVEGAIQRKFQGLNEDREAFLSAVRVKLTNNPALSEQVQAILLELGTRHYWTALDPRSSSSKRRY